MNDITVSSGALQVNEQVYQILEKKRVLEQQIEEVNHQMSEIQEAILKAMEENGIKWFENDLVRITYVEPTVRSSVDTAKLKKEGLYEFYKKDSPVKSSLRIRWKSDEEKKAMHEGIYDDTETF